ncbi:hypothetical protein OROGR_004853 [Orobanche gracilis]
MLDEEVRRQSVVKITTPDLLDAFDKPIPGGLYDPGTPCKSYGRSSHHCNGHYGHIDLVSPSYNPLLFNTLNNLLNKTCFYCLHFRSSREEDDIINREDRQGSHKSDPAVLSDNENQNENNVQASWDSFQLTEAISVVKEFLKKKEKKCANCKRENPKIDKATCGWFHVNGHSNADIRSNPVRSGRLDVTQSGGCEDKAHMNNSEHLTIIRRRLDLQQSINMLFDSKTASRPASSQSQEAIYRQPEMCYPRYFGLRLRHPQFLTHLDRNVAIKEVGLANLPDDLRLLLHEKIIDI